MLTIADITVRLGGRVILDGASSALPPGSRVGLIGRNGAGKSTLMRIVAGLGEADGGAVGMPRGTRIGYIAQASPDRKSTRLNSSHYCAARMPSSVSKTK